MLTMLLDVVLYFLVIALLVPVLIFCVQVICSWPIARAGQVVSRGPRPRMAVLVPAHNEAEGLGDVLARMVPQLAEGDRILVVADNCTDDTAGVARQAGAEVIERCDETLRGKGYALDFGVRHLQADPPDFVVIVDADCRVSPGALERIVSLSAETGRPIQALYLMRTPALAGRLTRVAEFAWRVKNLARPSGFLRLGLPCQLMGSGMAFPWERIAAARLATGHIVEDMQLGVDMARQGAAPLFCPDALVESDFPANPAGARSQRTRWEHGHLGMIVKEVPTLIAEGLRRQRGDVLALALDLCVPPVALLLMLVTLMPVFAALGLAAGASAGPLLLALLLFLMLGFSVAWAWLYFGRTVLPFSALMLAAVYAVGKVPVYVGFLVKRQVAWVRSRRDAERAD